jgi:hypothetical protein
MPPGMRGIWRSPATPRPAERGLTERKRRWVHSTHPTPLSLHHIRLAGRQPAFLQRSANPSASRLAPPTRPPSTSGSASSSATFFAFTEPP